MSGYVPLFQAIFDEDEKEELPKPRLSKLKESKDFKDFVKEYDTLNSREVSCSLKHWIIFYAEH